MSMMAVPRAPCHLRRVIIYMHIFEGTLRKQGEDTGRPFYIRRLTIEDLCSVLTVQKQVFIQLENKKILQTLSEEEFAYILSGHGLMLGAYEGNDLIAFRALLVPPLDEEHLGIDIGLSGSELAKVIYQEISVVLPAYRGNRLQKILAGVIMAELEKEGHSFRYICCTVAPFNVPSLKDKFAQGMQIAALTEKYGGLTRYVFVKDLYEPVPPACREVTPIPMNDFSAQKEKLAEGFRGIKMEEKENGLWIHYGRR